MRTVIFPLLRRARFVAAALVAALGVAGAVALSSGIDDVATAPTTTSPELRCDTATPCTTGDILARSARAGSEVDLADLGAVSTVSVVRAGSRPAPSAPVLRDSVLDLTGFEAGNYRVYVVLTTGDAYEVLLTVLP